MGLTPHADVDAVVGELRDAIRAILGERVVGLYLYGSLALGDFDRARSDIDLIAVTDRAVTAAAFARLAGMHARVRAGDSPWAERIEVAYIARDALDLPAPDATTHPQLEKGRELAREPLEIGWPFQRHTLREHGITVAGPAPATLLRPVAQGEMVAAALAITASWRRSRADPDWLAWVGDRHEQCFVLLTLCRNLYLLQHGHLASKPAAARWAQTALDRRWAALIGASLAREGSGRPLTAGELAETLAFLDVAAERLARAGT